MANSFFYRAVYTGLLLLILPAVVLANKAEDNAEVFSANALLMNETFIQDSIPHAKPSKKKPEEVKPDTKKTDIKEVPKSRTQLKPRVVIDRIKIKPVKIPRPKILKLL